MAGFFTPQEVAPQGATPPDDPFKWDDARKRKWDDRIAKAEAKRRDYEPWMEAALKIYSVSPRDNPEKYQSKIRTNRAFRNVERKSAGLLYRRPDVSVTPTPVLEAVPNGDKMAATHASIINEKLGVDHVDAEGVADRCIFDYLLCGYGVCKVGYRSFTVQSPHALEGQPDVADVPVKSECFIEHFSPKRYLIPADFDSTEFDKAPWQGMRFKMPLAQARRDFDLPPDWQPSNKPKDSNLKFDHGSADQEPSTDEVCGTEIYFRSSVYRGDVVHPDHLTKLVLIDGLDKPGFYGNDPDQTLNADGTLTADSRIGYPYAPLVVRVLTDSAYVMSDTAVTLPQINELDIYREQDVVRRAINLIRGFYNSGELDEKTLAKIVGSPMGGLIGLPKEVFENPLGPIRQMPPFNAPPDDAISAATIDSDLSQTIAIDSTAAGVSSGNPETATKSNYIAQHATAREGKEQNGVAKWYIRLVTKYSTLVQRYLTLEEAAAIVGLPDAQVWDSWRKMLPTRLAFTIEPDSTLRNDSPLHLKQLMDMFSYVANAPEVNRRYILTKIMHTAHIDPTRALLPQEQMPTPKSDPPKVSFSFDGEDVSPMSPQSPIVLEIMAAGGIQISAQAIQNAATIAKMVEALRVHEEAQAEAKKQQPHGGKLARAENLDKHQTDETGGMQNTGELMPGMAGPTQVQ